MMCDSERHYHDKPGRLARMNHSRADASLPDRFCHHTLQSETAAGETTLNRYPFALI